MNTLLERPIGNTARFNEQALRFKRQDHHLLNDLLQLKESHQTKIVDLLISNGYCGDNFDIIIYTLQSVYIEYDISLFHGHGPQSSVSLALIEQWADRRLAAMVCH